MKNLINNKFKRELAFFILMNGFYFLVAIAIGLYAYFNETSSTYVSGF